MALSCCENVVCITLRGNMTESFIVETVFIHIIQKTKVKVKKHYNVFKNHDYCYVEMSKEDNKILK